MRRYAQLLRRNQNEMGTKFASRRRGHSNSGGEWFPGRGERPTAFGAYQSILWEASLRGGPRARRPSTCRLSRFTAVCVKWSSQVKLVLSTKIQNSLPLVPGKLVRAAGKIEPPCCKVVRAAGKIARSWLGSRIGLRN